MTRETHPWLWKGRMQTVQIHRNRDAFMLYWYACIGNQPPKGSTIKRLDAGPACGHRERIWNSRDGVVPFGTSCPSCKHGVLQHVNWELDEYAPNHVLRKFQKYWSDITEERARAIAQSQALRAKAAGMEPPNIDDLMKHYLAEFDGHAPMLCVYEGP